MTEVKRGLEATHWADCWKSHPECALVKIREQDYEITRLKLENEKLKSVADSDHWYNAAMMYLKSLQEVRTLLKIIRGNADKAYDIANGKEV